MIPREYLIFGTIILATLLFFILTLVPFPFGSSSVEDKGSFDLNKSTKLEKISVPTSTNQNVFQINTSVSFQGFVYLTNIQKTAVSTPCTTTDASGSDPNCTTGRYSFCKCAATDCSSCIDSSTQTHTGYVPLFNINNVCILEVLGAPDASRQGRASTQLVLKTELAGDASANAYNTPNPLPAQPAAPAAPIPPSKNLYIETFVLPSIPYQKWTLITISRDGRRYDIYYNNRLVLSKYSSSMLYQQAQTNDVTVGHSTLNGTCGFFTMYKTIQSAEQIAQQYNSFITTRGDPIFDINPPTFNLAVMPDISVSGVGFPSLCSSDNCIDSIMLPRAKPMYEWSSEYT